MATPAAILSILVKTQGIAQAQTQLKSVDTNAKRSSGSVSKLSGAFKGLGVVAGVGGAAAALKSINDEYREAQKTGAQTNAVLKSTKGAANVTRREIETLAGAISKKSGIDDEQIQASQNMLLTFTKLRNETGKGNDIFNQATQTVTDMSVALGQSGKSSAIQLGKALNDPIKGITALRRVGVAFTADQQKQITAMVESGDQLGAQKVILRELATEFGGSATAQATAADKIKVSLGNLAEAAGAVLVPMLDKVFIWMTKVIDSFVKGEGVARFIIAGFVALGFAVGGTVSVISSLVSGFQQGNAGAVILGTTIVALTAGFVAYRAVLFASAAATRVMAAASLLMNGALLANPVGLVIAALVALGVALVIAYKKSETFRNIVNGAWAAVRSATTATFNAIVAVVRTAFNTITGIFRNIGPTLSGLIRGAVGAVTSAGRALGQGVINGFKDAFDLAKTIVTAVRNVIGQAAAWGIGVGRKLVDGIKSGIQQAAGAIGGAVKGVIDKANPFGDGVGIGKQVGALPSGKGAGSLMGAGKHMAPFAAIGARFGLRVSSGLRPGAVTSSGNPSHHASGNAVDLAGSPAAMMKAFRVLQGHAGRLAELIYTPGGAYSNGQRYTPTGALAADHFDHIHVAFTGGVGDGLGRMAGVGDGPGGGGNAKRIWQFLIAKGFTPAQAAGILGNLNQESRFDPAAREAGGRGPGHGIAQWSFGRATALKNFAKKRGKPWSDLNTQLAFMMNEFAGPENAAYKAVKGAKSVAEAESAFGLKYERYGVMGNRSGGQFLKMFQGVGGKAGGGSTTAGATAVERVNPLDQKLANADVAIEQAKRGPIKVGNRKISSALQQVAALTGKRQVIGKRIRSIRQALKGKKLSKAKRLALTQELSQRLGEHAQLGTDVKALRNPVVDPGIGADVGGGGGGEGDPNQPLIDAINAAAEVERERIEAEKAHTEALKEINAEVKRQTDFAQSVTNTSNFQLTKSLADILSGSIVGYGVAGRRLTPGTGVEVSY